MLRVFSIQKDILSGFKTYLASIDKYSKYTIAVNKSLGEIDNLMPAMDIYTKNSEPDSNTDSDSAGNHSRSFNIVFRIYLSGESANIEEEADSLYDVVVKYAKTNNMVRRVGNPTFNQLFAETKQITVAELEIPVYFRTKQA